jgi:hypothetical protein
MNLIQRHHFIAVLAFLALLELLTFGQIVGKIGFYLDDWNMLRQLHFGPQSLMPMLSSYFMGDPKIMPRPVELLHFVAMFVTFGLKPVGYHILNGIMEVATAWLSYVVVHRISAGNKTLALISSAIFLLYPIHDSTHYWIVASSCTLSLLCYMISLWWQIEGVAKSSKWLLAAGYLSFAISIFNYECYLPLFPINVAAALYVSTPKSNKWRAAVLQSIPYVLSIAAVLGYGRYVVPLLGQGWMHSTHIDPMAIILTVIRGAQVSFSPEPFIFLWDRLFRDAAWKNVAAWAAVGGAVMATAILLQAFSKEDRNSKSLAHVAFFGAAIILLSYTIFGLNPEYEPTLLTFVNRVNYAAALGAGMLFASGICALGKNKAAAPIILSTFIAFCMFGNWALSRPWTLSWMMQKHVQSVLTAHCTEFQPHDSIMLLNSPRYIMWAPVFDGAWDFQNLAQITLNDSTINGGVVSDRLRFANAQVSDVSSDFVCGKYNFDRMHALVATESVVLPVRTGGEFIDLISSHGMGFDLDQNLPSKWRTQLQLASRIQRTQ